MAASNHIQGVMSGKMIICGPRGLSLSENSEGQLPHFVANRSLKALITKSSAVNTRAPSTRPAAACRSIMDSWNEAAWARQVFSLSAALAGLPCKIAETGSAGSTSLFDVDSAASPGIVDALIRAEAMRTVILLMSGLQSCYEQTCI